MQWQSRRIRNRPTRRPATRDHRDEEHVRRRFDGQGLIAGRRRDHADRLALWTFRQSDRPAGGVRSRAAQRRVESAHPVPRVKTLTIPKDAENVIFRFGERQVQLTNLRKLFWKKLKLTKRDLLQYYADISPWLLPHLVNRAMVMKRYPNGAEGDFFYMKRAPEPRPEWIEICPIPHNEGLVNFPMVQDLPSLMWLINLGCIDLNQWYAKCDDWDRPDVLHFDLDPGPGADFEKVREVALRVRDILD